MAFHIQSVSQLALQARRRARAQGRWGASPWLPSPQTERWKQVCLCVNTAMMLLETQQAAIPLLGRSPRGLILDFVHVEQGGGRDQQCRWHSVKEKKKGRRKKTNYSCVSSSWYTNERLLRGDALLTILCKADNVIKKMSQVNFYCLPLAKILRSHRSQSLVCAIGIC